MENLKKLYKELATSAKGLSSLEAAKRLKKYGPNEVAKAQKLAPVWQFLASFKNPLIIILIIAAVISGATGSIKNALIILFMILLSTVLNFYQEFKSAKAAAKIAKQLQLQVTALRDSKQREILNKEVVPGDVLCLDAGSIIAADGLLIEADDFFVNESSLTGESFPVEKRANESKEAIILAGSTVVSGFAKMLAAKTGINTQIGKVTQSLVKKEEINAFEKGLVSFGMIIVKVIIFIILIVFLINAVLDRNLIESFLFSLAIAVGVTPELLPVILAINMGKASVNMAKRGVIVKRLDCIPDFGSMDLLCTDKTGTLTQDKITLVRFTDLAGTEDESVLRLAYINGYFETGIKSLLDKAIIDFRTLAVDGLQKIDEIPYDFMRRRSSIIYEDKNQKIMVTKGAPEEIFKICTQYHLDRDEQMSVARLQQFKNYYEDLSRQGFRVLAIATKYLAGHETSHIENNMTLRGFVAFYDPPKKDIKPTLDLIKNHGVEIKILTGDSALVTTKICEELGLKVSGIISGEELDINNLSDQALAIKVAGATICARLSPSQKERIILALKKQGRVIGYLGDGINDAPALKAADVGISVDNAVDVAKEAADIILMKKGLAEIMDAVIEGRRTFGNAMKYMLMSLSSNFGNMFSMIGAALFLPFLPMTAGQILLNNFVYDVAQLSIPSDNVDSEYLAKPKQWNLKFIIRYMLVFGPISSVFDFFTFWILYSSMNLQAGAFQAGWFLESLATQVLVIYVIRTRKIPFIQSRPSGLLALTTVLAVFFALLVVMTGLGEVFGFAVLTLPTVLMIGALVLAYLVIVEVAKQIFYRKFHQPDA
jgi:Mg2+-importing ATPase